MSPSQNAKAGPGPRTKSLKAQAARKRLHPKRHRKQEDDKKLKVLQQSVANFVRSLTRPVSRKFTQPFFLSLQSLSMPDRKFADLPMSDLTQKGMCTDSNC